MWFQAKSSHTLLKRNIFFDGPRAGVNFNDGFKGGNVVEENLIFGQCAIAGGSRPLTTHRFLLELVLATVVLGKCAGTALNRVWG